jgi:hypothetical protein
MDTTLRISTLTALSFSRRVVHHVVGQMRLVTTFFFITDEHKIIASFSNLSEMNDCGHDPSLNAMFRHGCRSF